MDKSISEADNTAAYWRAVVEAAGLGVWDYNTVTGEKRYSLRWREIHNLSPQDPLPASDEEWFESLHPDDIALARHYTNLINRGEADEVAFEYRERGRTGAWVWIMCRGRAVGRNEDGSATRFVGIDTDITELKSVELARSVEAKQLEIAVTMAEIGIWKFDFDTGVVTWDSCLRNIYGIVDDLEPLPRDIWERCLHPDDLDRAMKETRDNQETKTDYSIEFRIVRPSGEIRHIRSRVGYPSDPAAGSIIIGVNWDVTEEIRRTGRLEDSNRIAEQRLTELKLVRNELEHLSLHYPLTGLPNRRSLDVHLNRISSGETVVANYAFMQIDIDQFKKVNDTHGHQFGDEVLKEVASALRDEIAYRGHLVRSGGDEFLALICDFRSREDLFAIATTAISRVRKASETLGAEVSVSIGIEVYWDEISKRDQLFGQADRAMYRAKNDGGGVVYFAE